MKTTVAPACLGLAAALAACGSQSVRMERDWSSANQVTADGMAPKLAVSPDDEILETLVIDMGKEGNGFSLSEGNAEAPAGWNVDLQSRHQVDGAVAPEKYLRVKGSLSVPQNAAAEKYEIGCLFVELKDNVSYRERTWLRLGSTGIRGTAFKEVELPLLVNRGAWNEVPVLPGALTLGEFKENSTKKFDGTLCFRLDFTGAPAQKYQGQIVIQYLKPAPSSQDEVPANLVCDTKPLLLRAGQSAEFGWTAPDEVLLETSLALDPPQPGADLGSVATLSANRVRYKSPAQVRSKGRVLVTAKAIGAEMLPAFCEVTLVPDDDIAVADDGETEGLLGNVYRLAADTQKLPDFGKMQPVAAVLAPNLDVPERSFSQGFPGVRDLFEWFGIRFYGTLKIATGGVWEFKLTADDGAKLYIDDALIVDNDGVHPTTTKTGSAALSKGEHKIRMDYFQGPRYHITLQLYSRLQGQGDYKVIPPSDFSRPLSPN